MAYYYGLQKNTKTYELKTEVLCNFENSTKTKMGDDMAKKK